MHPKVIEISLRAVMDTSTVTSVARHRRQLESDVNARVAILNNEIGEAYYDNQSIEGPKG